MVFNIAICKYIINSQEDSDSVSSAFFGVYQMMYGENPEYDNVMISFARVTIYFISSNLIVIICLNILISIVTDKYEDVMYRLKAIDFKMQAEMLQTAEKVNFWTSKNYPTYFFVIKYSSE